MRMRRDTRLGRRMKFDGRPCARNGLQSKPSWALSSRPQPAGQSIQACNHVTRHGGNQACVTIKKVVRSRLGLASTSNEGETSVR
ncbi:hypothetical protein IQ07DRAFT_590354 [Pyrenochaeta sp. DS3sAY3a]|nr:hypothetical protein IQ07DRAFT_590354 [Pyrenochaeta sp. DS3sAY3a]